MVRFPGLAEVARYSGRDILLISALRHWDALGLKITDRIAGNVIYAVRSARMPIVLVRQEQNESVIAVPVENLADSLSGPHRHGFATLSRFCAQRMRLRGAPRSRSVDRTAQSELAAGVLRLGRGGELGKHAFIGRRPSICSSQEQTSPGVPHGRCAGAMASQPMP